MQEPKRPLLEHAHGRIAVARIDEPGLLALEPRLGRLGAVIDEARGQIERLGRLAEFRAVETAAHQQGFRIEMSTHHVALSTSTPPAEGGGRAASVCGAPDLLAMFLTWSQAG